MGNVRFVLFRLNLIILAIMAIIAIFEFAEMKGIFEVVFYCLMITLCIVFAIITIKPIEEK